MGCGASKNDVIKSAASSGNEPTAKEPTANGDTRANGNVHASSSNSKNSSSRDSLTSSNISEGSTIPASEKFGNGSTTPAAGNNNDVHGRNVSGNNSNANKNLPELPPLKPARTSKVGFLDQSADENMAEEGARGMPVAFEVPAEEDASLIKKHPPRRLRQLEERPPDTNAVTQEALEEKVALANERRNQVLHQRVASARQKSARAGGRVRRPVMDAELEASETMESGLEGNPTAP